MTRKEYIQIHHPDAIGAYEGGVFMCPKDYPDLLDIDSDARSRGSQCGSDQCHDCWNAEIHGTENESKQVDNSVTINPNPHILDSGNRREFESGAVRDIQEGKGRCDLLPLDVVAEIIRGVLDKYREGDPYYPPFREIARFQETGDEKYLITALRLSGVFNNYFTMFLEVAIHFEEGAKKYGENNWQKGIPVHCYIDSAIRHYLKFLRGDTDEPHDRAFCWNLMCAAWTCKHMPELNEYARKESADANQED